MKKMALITLLVAFGFASDFEKCKECIGTKPINECINLKVCEADINKTSESSAIRIQFKYPAHSFDECVSVCIKLHNNTTCPTTSECIEEKNAIREICEEECSR